jgi:hypothetical protein
MMVLIGLRFIKDRLVMITPKMQDTIKHLNARFVYKAAMVAWRLLKGKLAK